MPPADQLLLLLATIAYVGALWRSSVRLLKQKPPNHSLTFALILTGWLLQSAGLYMRGMEAGSCPIRNMFEILQFVSWSMLLVYLLTGQIFRLSIFGTASASLAALLSAGAFLIPGADTLPQVTYLPVNPWVETHASLAVFSYGIFALLSALAVLYLLQNHSLKAKRFDGVFRFLPPIVEMEVVLFRLLLTACIVFSAALLIGAVYWVGHPDQIGWIKVAPTLALWFAYCLALFLRLLNLLYGTRLAMVSIALFMVALLTLWPVEMNRGHLADQQQAAPPSPCLLAARPSPPHVV